jgi:hypothetical protein
MLEGKIVRLQDVIEKLTMICGHCGEEMRYMGEWPVQFPKTENINIQQALRWTCCCRYPVPGTEHTATYSVSLSLVPTRKSEQ